MSQHSKSWVDERNIWFVRLDVYLIGRGHPISETELLDALIAKSLRVLREHSSLLDKADDTRLALEQLSELSEGQPRNKKEACFSLFVQNFYRECGRRLVIFIDNVDYLYHMNDRVMFTEAGAYSDTQAIACVTNLVHMFIHDGHGGSLGALAACVLFSLRPDSYDILHQSNGLFRPGKVFDHNRNVVYIAPAKWELVGNSRAQLLAHAVSTISRHGKRDVHSEFIEPILHDLKFNPQDQLNQLSLIGHLEKITNYGLRDIVEFFSQYSWLEGQSFGTRRDLANAGLERLLHSYPVGLLAFMLGGWRRFNQFRSRFPNIYLVNVQPDTGASDATPALSTSHEHTYWLKRLLLSFIRAQGARSLAVKPERVYQVFSGEGGYSHELVSACLGSMAQSDISNLLRVDKGRSVGGVRLQVEKISVTVRGEHCIDHIFDRFFYLQLVVEDFMLPIPRSVVDIFDLEKAPDYAYIGAAPGEYREMKRAMIATKAFQVLVFLEILSVSLTCEQIRYEHVFKNLDKYDIVIPDIQHMRDGIIKEIHSLRRTGSVSFEIADLLQRANRLRPAIEKNLESIYNIV